MKDCDTAALYYTKKFGKTIPEVCDTLIDDIFETLTFNETISKKMQNMLPDLCIDEKKTKFQDFCNSTCPKGDSLFFF